MLLENKILNFVYEMGYLNNEHVLGILLYGSYLTGFHGENSDIDLHIVFDNENPNHLIKGNKIIDGIKIEYFEKPINDLYLEIENGYFHQNNASFSIIGKGTIVFERENQLSLLQQYAINRFSSPMPCLSEEDTKEQVSILNNKLEKLRQLAETDSSYFEHLYHLTIEKIRRFYHNVMGIPRIETSKGFRLYTDEKYREAFCIHQIPEHFFIEMYFFAISNMNEDKIQKYHLLCKIYGFTKRNIVLDKDYRILIKSRNIGNNQRR